MTKTTVQARISRDLKREAEAVFDAIGMSTADAIRIFLTQAVNTGGLPFQPTAKIPNAETLAAIEELETGGGRVHQSSEDLFANL